MPSKKAAVGRDAGQETLHVDVIRQCPGQEDTFSGAGEFKEEAPFVGDMLLRRTASCTTTGSMSSCASDAMTQRYKKKWPCALAPKLPAQAPEQEAAPGTAQALPRARRSSRATA